MIDRKWDDPGLRAALGSSPPLEKMKMTHTPNDGDILTVTSRYTQHECETCGEPATKRHTFLLPFARRNERSRAYGKDNISWCSDADVFTCDEHKPKPPVGMDPSYGTFTKTDNINHMFFYWHEVKREITPAQEPTKCDCAAATNGKWAGIHSPNCEAVS